MTDTDNSVRLAKRVAEMRPCSRREAELYIEGGYVSVDGSVVEESGARVSAEQQISIAADASLLEIVPVTILLNKPAGANAGGSDGGLPALNLVHPDTLLADPRNERFLKRHVTGQQLTIPLDTSASGLVVYTQDFRVARKLIDDASRTEQEIIVEVQGTIAANGLAQLNQIPGKVSWQNENRLRFAIKGARPGLIERLCREVGLTVVSMKRIRIGRIAMASLPVGQWRYLQGYERF